MKRRSSTTALGSVLLVSCCLLALAALYGGDTADEVEATAALQGESDGTGTADPAGAEQSATPGPQLRVIVSSANVRKGPGTNYEVVTIVNEDSTVSVVARTNNGEWYNVELPGGQSAWIAVSVTEPVNFEVTSIAPALTIPAPPVQAQPADGGAPAQPTSTPPPAVAEPCSCSGPDLDCGHFTSHAAAQACYNYCVSTVGYDYHRLDGRDNDGLACESLP